MALTSRKRAAPTSDLVADGVGRLPTLALLLAAIGVVSLMVVVVGWSRWLASGPVAAPLGPDPFPAWKRTGLVLFQIAFFLPTPFFLWRCLIRPLRRDRRLGLEGMIVIAALTLWFYDPVDNYFNFSFVYNAHLLNVGTWAQFIPGYRYPAGYPEPLLLVGGIYINGFIGISLLGAWFMRKVHAARPRFGPIGLIGSCIGVLTAMTFLLEFVMLRLEIWGYPGASHFLTIFAGTRYQYPLVNPLLGGLAFALFPCLLYFRDDRGSSYADRGVDRLGLTGWQRRSISTLAVIGATHLGVFVLYYMPYSWLISMVADTPPALPSYLRAGQCGTGTSRACPSRSVPIPGRDSIQIAPDDPRLPAEVRNRQGFGRG